MSVQIHIFCNIIITFLSVVCLSFLCWIEFMCFIDVINGSMGLQKSISIQGLVNMQFVVVKWAMRQEFQLCAVKDEFRYMGQSTYLAIVIKPYFWCLSHSVIKRDQ